MPQEPSKSQRDETLLSASLLKDGTSSSTVSISTLMQYLLRRKKATYWRICIIKAKKWAAFIVKYRVLITVFPQEYTIGKKIYSLHFTSKEYCKGQPLEPAECII